MACFDDSLERNRGLQSQKAIFIEYYLYFIHFVYTMMIGRTVYSGLGTDSSETSVTNAPLSNFGSATKSPGNQRRVSFIGTPQKSFYSTRNLANRASFGSTTREAAEAANSFVSAAVNRASFGSTTGDVVIRSTGSFCQDDDYVPVHTQNFSED